MMVDEFKLFTGALSFYIGSGMIYNEFVKYRINHWELGKLLRYMISPPTYIRVLNFIFAPILKIANYMRLKQIIEEERLEDLEEIMLRKVEDDE
jgi:hypothetical protein